MPIFEVWEDLWEYMDHVVATRYGGSLKAWADDIGASHKVMKYIRLGKREPAKLLEKMGVYKRVTYSTAPPARAHLVRRDQPAKRRVRKKE